MQCSLEDQQKYEGMWSSVKIRKDLSFRESAIVELKEYFSFSTEKTEYLLLNSEKLLAEEWIDYFNKNTFSEKSVIGFYDKTSLEIFELMNWHYLKFLNGPLQYAFAMEVAKQRKLVDYLDYGSGAGTGGLFFALNNFNVALADISKTNLDFCKYRFKKRNLSFELIDLKNNIPKANSYDVITCFDVLEHSLEPIKVLRTLCDSLKENGMLILTMPFGKDKDRPMHIVTNPRISCNIRSIGFAYDQRLIRICREEIKRNVFFLYKKKRGFFEKKIYFIYDNAEYLFRRIIKKLKLFTKIIILN